MQMPCRYVFERRNKTKCLSVDDVNDLLITYVSSLSSFEGPRLCMDGYVTRIKHILASFIILVKYVREKRLA
jgi:hypothetical protein